MRLKFHHLPAISTIVGGVSTSHYLLKWGGGFTCVFSFTCVHTFLHSGQLRVGCVLFWFFFSGHISIFTFGARDCLGSWMLFLRTQMVCEPHRCPAFQGRECDRHLASGSLLLIQVKLGIVCCIGRMVFHALFHHP